MLCKLKIIPQFLEVYHDFPGRMDGFYRRQNHGAIFLEEWMISDEGKSSRFCVDVMRFMDKVVVLWVVRNYRGAIFSGAVRFCLSLCTI